MTDEPMRYGSREHLRAVRKIQEAYDRGTTADDAEDFPTPARGDLVHDRDRNRTGVVLRAGKHIVGGQYVDVRFPYRKHTVRYGADSSRDLRALRILPDD